MTQTVAKECSWSRSKVSKKDSGDLSLTLMEKAHKFPRGYTSGFVPDYRHAVEAVGESEGFTGLGQVGSEDPCTPKRRCISLNADRCDGFFVPMQVIALSNMSSTERKDLEIRLRRELEQVQKFQKKILSSTALMSNGASVSSSCDPLVKKHDLAIQNASQLKRSATGRFESTTKQVKHFSNVVPTSVTVLMKQCEALLKRLLGHQYAWVFNKPVDVVKLNIPDYFTVIKRPMDLGTIQSNLASGFYTAPMEFASDVRLTFSNATTYNPPGNDVHFMADAMSKFFEMRWKPIEKKLVAADGAIKRETVTTKPVQQSKKRKIHQEGHNTVVLDSKVQMTDEEKLSLSRRLSLIPELPQHIVDFLKRHTDNANESAEDEIEIDFDSLSSDTLFELKKLLDDYSKQNHSENQAKTEPCEVEILNESGLSNSSMHPCKGNEPVDEDEDVDIGGNDPPTTSYFPVDGVNNAAPRSNRGSSSSSSSSESGSSSSDSDSGSTSRSRSNINASSSPNSTKGKGPQIAPSPGKGHVSAVQREQGGTRLKNEFAKSTISQEGENAPSERQVSPDKLYRAALLRSRFADTILKAREKTLDQGEKKDPEKLRREREELERQQREERARLQAEAKAAEDARRRAEEEAAAEAKRKRELEREAARQALLQMEKTVEINEGNLFLKDLEMLRTAPGKHLPGSANEGIPDLSTEGIDDFKLGGSNPLEQLGLYMKADDDEEEECDEPSSMPDVEEGEID
ncbi:transcription factor GTE9-like [Dendrobium catenatum]|uniref:transcription factor GTE9-like n=1 Tax=Dendrobium catenatum TaxID=906689 RepID=UPI0009F5C5EA|nr:transcription factor GTE9-like [Dendrobium catenatum]XP_028554434.1 transcription factor GTE9-like [Dendrobium catenatum]